MDTFNIFFNVATGNRPDDYYFIHNSKGAKCYYSKITGRKIAKDNIPGQFHDLIKERDLGMNIGQLGDLKKTYLLEIEKLKAKVMEIDLKLAQLNVNDEEVIKEYRRRKEEEDRRDALRREEYQKERKELLRKLFERSSYQKYPSANERRDENILSKLNINNKKEWKDWLVKNHPDKGGDSDLCSQVIDAGRNKNW